MKAINIFFFLYCLPFIGFAQTQEDNQLENEKPDIHEFSRQKSLLHSFSSFIQVDELDPRVKYMYQSSPFQQSINMQQLALQQDRSEQWYNYNKNPQDFAQRQQAQINEAVKFLSDDSKVQLRVEEGFQNQQFNRFGRLNSIYRNNSFYYPQRSVRLEIDFSKD